MNLRSKVANTCSFNSAKPRGDLTEVQMVLLLPIETPMNGLRIANRHRTDHASYELFVMAAETVKNHRVPIVDVNLVFGDAESKLVRSGVNPEWCLVKAGAV